MMFRCLSRWSLVALCACGSAPAAPGDATPSAPTFSRSALLKPNDPIEKEGFGARVAISGDGSRLAIGDVGAANANGLPTGGVAIFERVGDGWEPAAYLQPSTIHQGDSFGSAVALSTSGDTLVVGALHESGGSAGVDGDPADQSVSRSGAAYVFKSHGAQWAQQAYLKASHPGAMDYFGWSVAIAGDGNTVAVNALYEASSAAGIDGDQLDDSMFNAGAVYAFGTDGAKWAQQAYIKASNPDAGDGFGMSLALSADGSRLVAGAASEASGTGDPADNSAYGAGAVYAFDRTAGHWAQTAYLKASDPHGGDAFGESLALTGLGSTLVIGATGRGDAATANTGAAFAFQLGGATWTASGVLAPPAPTAEERFGDRVSLSADGKTLVVRDRPFQATLGTAFLYARGDGVWQPPSMPLGAGPTQGLDLHLSATGAVIIVGDPFDDLGQTDSGAVHVYY